MSIMQLRSHLLIPDGMDRRTALIVGAGTVGSNVAMSLASIGVRRFAIVDYDTVSTHNLASQVFQYDQIGLSKAESLATNLRNRFDIEKNNIEPIHDKFTASFHGKYHGKGDYEIIVSAADSMTARKCVSMWSRGTDARVVDTRCAGHEVQTWAYDANDREQYAAYVSTLYADSEASSLPCGGEMYPSAGLAAAINTLAAVSSSGFFYRMVDTELATITR